jgi:hypothetical protein
MVDVSGVKQMNCNHEYNYDYFKKDWMCHHCGDRKEDDDKTDYVGDIRNHLAPTTVVIDN